MGIIFGLIILIGIITFIAYQCKKLLKYYSSEARLQRRLQKEQLAKEEACCSACGRKFTKDKMKLYKIVDKQKDMGISTEYISGGLGGSKTVRRTQVFYHNGYICKKCDHNWDIACLIWILVMGLGEAIAYFIYYIWGNENGDFAFSTFFICTAIFLFIARKCWRMYRIHTKCDIKILQ